MSDFDSILNDFLKILSKQNEYDLNLNIIKFNDENITLKLLL